jgi:hypothetical protein
MLALVAAPAIVRATSLMPVSVMPDEEILVQLANRNKLLTIHQITREAVRMFVNTNAFIQNINRQVAAEYVSPSLLLRIATEDTFRPVLSPV